MRKIKCFLDIIYYISLEKMYNKKKNNVKMLDVYRLLMNILATTSVVHVSEKVVSDKKLAKEADWREYDYG